MLHAVQDIDDLLVGKTIKDKRSTPLDLDKQGTSQLFEMVGYKGLGKMKFFYDLADGFFFVPYRLQNQQPVGITQALGQKGQLLVLPCCCFGNFF